MNSPLVVLLLSVVPGLLWVWYFFRQDKYEKEPKSLILKCFLFGGLMILPAGILEAPFRPFIEGEGGLLGTALVSFFVIGLAEEAVKLLGVHLATNREPHLNEVMDGIVYSVSVGLGFATLENIMYIGVFGAGVGAVRAVLTNLAHASFSGVAGYFYGLWRIKPAIGGSTVFKGMALAVILHGVYDFVVLGRIAPGISAIAVIVASYGYLRKLMGTALKNSPYRR